MKKQELIHKLISNHQAFTRFFSTLDDSDFTFSITNEKWSAGQHADHIFRSIKPLKTLLGLPKWLIKLFLKKANRPSKSYEQLIAKYLQILDKGGRAPGRFIPGKIPASRKNRLRDKIQTMALKGSQSINKYSEQELDELVLPHPLLGKLTLREMIYFTIYHVEHHHTISTRSLALKAKER